MSAAVRARRSSAVSPACHQCQESSTTPTLPVPISAISSRVSIKECTKGNRCRARDVIVPNPVVAEAMLHSPRRITIIGLQPGETDAVVLDASGRTILSLRIRVDAGVSALQDTLSRVMPGSQVRAEAVNDSIILTGTAARPGKGVEEL